MGRRTNPPNPRRHLLPLLRESADLFVTEFARGIFPGRVGDLLAYHGTIAILERARTDPAFPDIVSQLETPEGFRHNMVMLGLWDLMMRHSPHRAHLVPPSFSTGRIVDLIIGELAGPSFHVEVKAPMEFDPPRANVTPSQADDAVRREWRRALHGPIPQVAPDTPAILLLGGLTLRLECLPIVKRAAEKWLDRRGASHPNVWGIAILTYFSYTRLPPGRSFGDGAPMVVDSASAVHLAAAENRYYTGTPRIHFTPFSEEDYRPAPV